jgi:hypothetical protein
MRASRILGLGTAAVAWLCFTSGAFATGVPTQNSINYSAPTVALNPPGTGNTVAIPPGQLSYSTAGTGTTLKGGDTIVWNAPALDNWVANGAPNCNSGALVGTLTGFGTPTLTCTLAGAVTVTSVTVQNAGGTFPVSLQGPDVQLLGVPAANQSPIVPITARNTGANGVGTVIDPAPIANTQLTSSNLFFLNAFGQRLGIDLTGAGLPAIPPGGGFTTTPASGTGTPAVSLAGYIGGLQIFVSTFNFDARNGLQLNNNDPLFTNGSLTGAVTVTLLGDFATINTAYLLPNNNGSPSGANSGDCVGGTGVTLPANRINGTITGNRTISFTGLGNPGNPTLTGGVNTPTFSVCLVTNGTQVIQASPNINITASVAIAQITNPIPLTTPNQFFSSIGYNGSEFFAANVFGAADGAETFFRVVNESNAPVQVWAVLTKDVINQMPETGQGSCTFPATGGTTPITATCNTSFVANLTAAAPTATGLITTNLTNSAGLVQSNTGTFYTADDIAKLAGTTLPASSLIATVHLLSPSAGVRFSALTQSTVFGVLVQTP